MPNDERRKGLHSRPSLWRARSHSAFGIHARAGLDSRFRPTDDALAREHVGGAGAEIAGYDPDSRRVFSINTPGRAIDVIDITNPAAPALLRKVK